MARVFYQLILNQMLPILPKIDSRDVEPFKYNYQIFRANIPVETKVSDLLTPEIWTNVLVDNVTIKAGDIIECVKQDFSAFIQLIVVGREKKGLLVELIHQIDFTKKDLKTRKSEISNESEIYEAKWCGPNKKFAIVRKSDGEELISGIVSKQEVEGAIASKAWLNI